MTQPYLKQSVTKTVSRVTLQILLVLIFVALFFVIGLFIGYSVIGEGNYWEVLNRDTWQHIIDFIQ